MMNAKVYSEVFSILKMLGNKYIDAIPQEIMSTIKNSIDNDYQPIYTIDSIDKENISTETLSTIAYFNMEYWHKNIDEDNIINILYEN